MKGEKVGNEFQRALAEPLYRACPKAVLAAIAVSSLTEGGGFLDEADTRLVTEWEILHAQGLVPQPVPARFRGLAVEAGSR